MHHSLEIQEILLNIIRHCYSPGRWGVAPDLPTLARTCRAFKDPVLDVLWEELHSGAQAPIPRLQFYHLA